MCLRSITRKTFTHHCHNVTTSISVHMYSTAKSRECQSLPGSYTIRYALHHSTSNADPMYARLRRARLKPFTFFSPASIPYRPGNQRTAHFGSALQDADPVHCSNLQVWALKNPAKAQVCLPSELRRDIIAICRCVLRYQRPQVATSTRRLRVSCCVHASRQLWRQRALAIGTSCVRLALAKAD